LIEFEFGQGEYEQGEWGVASKFQRIDGKRKVKSDASKGDKVCTLWMECLGDADAQTQQPQSAKQSIPDPYYQYSLIDWFLRAT